MQRIILQGCRSGFRLYGQKKKVTHGQKTNNTIISDVAQDVVQGAQGSSADRDLEEPREKQKKEVAQRACYKTVHPYIPAMLDMEFQGERAPTDSSRVGRAIFYVVAGIGLFAILSEIRKV